jgi:hypothetical protein
MAEPEPVTELNAFSSDDAIPAEWGKGHRELQHAEVYWLSTVRPDGRPHVRNASSMRAIAPAGWQNSAVTVADDQARRALLRRGLALEYATLAWNVAGIAVRPRPDHLRKRDRLGLCAGWVPGMRSAGLWRG